MRYVGLGFECGVKGEGREESEVAMKHFLEPTILCMKL